MVLEYRIDVRQSAQRELVVALAVDVHALGGDGPGGGRDVEFFLPTWTPGSYLQREYSRHLSRVSAMDAGTGQPLDCRKITKNRYRVAAGASSRLRLSYEVHAHELSVRTADATAAHAYWNHACLLLWPCAALQVQAHIEVVFPSAWRLACALPQRDSHPAPAGTQAVILTARNLAEACDAPCLVGTFERLQWNVDGVPHAIVLDGLAGITPPASLVADLSAIVAQAAAVFGGGLPYPHYLFLVLFAADGHGGLEHGESSTLLVNRTAFATAKGYREFLSLAAHELFHAWNVKRLRPVEFWQYDYETENYTDFLWLVEGWTAYYDDLLCVRAGLVTRQDYLGVVANNLSAMLAAPGRLRLSLRESSFDAWIRLYRPDANTRNSSQNYYGNGAVAAMCFDLVIRRESGGQRCLDHVFAELWRTTFARGRGYVMADVQLAVRAVAGETVERYLAELIDGPLDPPFESLLAGFGLRTHWRERERPYLGVQFESGGLTIGSVIAGSPAFAAGLCPGDEILALSGLRADAARWADLLGAVAPGGAAIDVLLSRRGVIQTCRVTPQAGPGTLAIEVDAAASTAARSLLDGWIPEKKSCGPAEAAPAAPAQRG